MQVQPVSPGGEVTVLDGFLTEAQLAKQLRRTQRTLQRWHVSRIGPPRIELGRLILYSAASVRAWIQSQERSVRRGRNGRK